MSAYVKVEHYAHEIDEVAKVMLVLPCNAAVSYATDTPKCYPKASFVLLPWFQYFVVRHIMNKAPPWYALHTQPLTSHPSPQNQYSHY